MALRELHAAPLIERLSSPRGLPATCRLFPEGRSREADLGNVSTGYGRALLETVGEHTSRGRHRRAGRTRHAQPGSIPAEAQAGFRAWSLSPEDRGWVTADFPQQVIDMWRGRDLFVEVEPEVAIAPVQRPAPGRFDVPEPRDRQPRPLRACVLAPGRPAFHDRQMPQPYVTLNSDLIAGMLRHALFAPAPHPRHIQLRQTCLRHPASLSVGSHAFMTAQAPTLRPGLRPEGVAPSGQPYIAIRHSRPQSPERQKRYAHPALWSQLGDKASA